MLINFARTVILYIVIIASMRILGKRQIGELQPAELVITILLSEILAIPMQDTSLPLMNTIIPVLLLVGFEIIISILNLKSVKFRSAMQGNPLIVIREGVLQQMISWKNFAKKIFLTYRRFGMPLSKQTAL